MKSFTPKDLREVIAKQAGQAEPARSSAAVEASLPSETGESRWQSWVMACGTTRHKLFLNGLETPYFVDHARHRAHYMLGDPIGLYGSGMGTPVQCPDGSSYRIAKILGSFQSIREAKRQAESLADSARHDFTTQDSQEIEKYWKEKEGKCLGCNADIAVDEQYCKSCNDFLLETLPTHNQ